MSGGNDRPVRNDLDRQPATQSSNVQAIVIDPTLAGQPIGNVNTLPPSPPTPPAAAAVAPAVTERPRPPAPVAQILFPTTTDTSNTTTTTSTTTTTTIITNTTDTTTTSTSTSNSGPVELTSIAASAPAAPSNSVTSSSNLISPSGGTVLAASTSDPLALLPLSSDAGTEQDSTATAGPVVPVPVNYYLNITNGGSLTLWMVHVTLGDTRH